MSKPHTSMHIGKHRTFVPQLRERRDRIVYRGALGAIGATPRSRYQLVAFSAVAALIVLTAASFINPELSAVAAAIVVALIAGGWPAATGVAELRSVNRIYTHSAIILLSGLSSVALAYIDHGLEQLGMLPAIAAVGIVTSFIVELVRGEGAIGRLESVISCVSGVLAAVSVAGWVGLADIFAQSKDTSTVLGIGFAFALLIGAFGVRLISAGPTEGPRRGAITLGVTPVAFVGVIAYVIAIFLTSVLG